MRRILGLCLILGLLGSGCSKASDPWKGSPVGQTKVLAVFPPLYCFAANVAKNDAHVLCLLTGTGPHEYEATTSDARKVGGADLFLVNGLGLESDFSRRLLQMARKTAMKPVAIGDAIDPKLLVKMAPHAHEEGDDHHHHHGDHDPHVWLGPKQAQAMVAVVAEKLAEASPGQKEQFAKNAAEYIEKLKELEAYGRDKFKDKKSKSFITMHESLRYFADGFGLDLVDSIQPRPGVEADANQLARLVDACKKKNVSVIAVEPQYSRGQADSLARVLRAKGLDVQVVTVDPIETADPRADGNPDPNLYIERMKANIDALARAFP